MYSRYVCVIVRTWTGTDTEKMTIKIFCRHGRLCFTICLFIGPDLDGCRASKMIQAHDRHFMMVGGQTDRLPEISFVLNQAKTGVETWMNANANDLKVST